MKLSQKQRDQLWGEEGPYSEARLIIEHRGLDDTVSRVFVVVEVQKAVERSKETLIRMHKFVIDLLGIHR